MDPLVHCQGDLQPETFAALAAGVRALTYMRDLVLAQARLVAEAALALAALVGFPRGGRRPGLRLEAALVREGLSSPGWGSHPTPRGVQALVQQELLLDAKAEVTGMALVGPLLEVVPLVDDVIDPKHEALATLRTDVRPLANPISLLEGDWPGLPAIVPFTQGGADPHRGPGRLDDPLILPHHIWVAIQGARRLSS